MIRNELNSEEDLLDAVTQALERKGILSKIRANLRTEVYHSLEDKTVLLPEKPAEVFLVSELIREFLISLNLNNTLSVFCEEMGQPSEMQVDRTFLGGELGLNVIGNEESIPLLLLIVQYLMKNKQSLLEKVNHSIVTGYSTTLHDRSSGDST